MPARVIFSSSDGDHINLNDLRRSFIAYMLAKKYHGSYIFRLDNVQQRSEKSSSLKSRAYEDLVWLGLNADESPLNPNPIYSPYVQSERLDIYQRYIDRLLAMQIAYKKIPPREKSASLTETRPAIYFKMDSLGDIAITDLRLGKIPLEKINSRDWVIVNSSGQPTVEFAAMVDDHLMNITHVVSESDNLPNLGRYIALYRALNWQVPSFLHLPNIKLDGESEEKLVYKFREEGYVPEAICDYLYHLDFGEKSTNKVSGLDDLIKEFEIIKMKAGHQCFDIRVLRKINAAHIKQMADLSYAAFIRPFIKTFIDDSHSDDYLFKLALIYKTQISYGREIHDYLRPFLLKNPDFTPREQQIINNTQSQFVISSFKEALSEFDFDASNFSELILRVQKKTGIAGANFYQPLRLVLAHMDKGPELEEIIKFLGKEETLIRLNQDND
ncbi:MAG: glutamate--tRNA ligase family protein [Bacilli bacterium]|nr:glutamate--tRNA ligase family protein [Bacilli bacterium]